jgi:hypothetical protein
MKLFFALEIKHKSNHSEITYPPVGLEFYPSQTQEGLKTEKPAEDSDTKKQNQVESWGTRRCRNRSNYAEKWGLNPKIDDPQH